jgi:tRNA A-37 threonylcarbamoyl transferase component Bud32
MFIEIVGFLVIYEIADVSIILPFIPAFNQTDQVIFSAGLEIIAQRHFNLTLKTIHLRSVRVIVIQMHITGVVHADTVALRVQKGTEPVFLGIVVAAGINKASDKAQPVVTADKMSILIKSNSDHDTPLSAAETAALLLYTAYNASFKENFSIVEKFSYLSAFQ